MSFTESSADVLDASFLTINNADTLSATAQFAAPDGTAAAPVYSFENDSGGGMFLTSTEDVALAVGGEVGLVMSANRNTAWGGGAPSSYGATTPGSGAVYINPVTTPPSGTLTGGGGMLYVSGTNLIFYNANGTEYVLNARGGDVTGPVSSTAGALALFDGGTGKIIKDSVVVITDSSTLTTADGTVAQTAYSFTGDPDTGLYLAGVGDVRLAAGATDAIAATSSAITAGVAWQVPDGSVVAPGWAVGAATAGLTLSGTDLIVVAGGVAGLVAQQAGATVNVALAGGAPSDYGAGTAGEGVVFLNAATSVPTTGTTGGGMLYVVGDDLFFVGGTAVPRNLTTCVEEASGTTTVNGVVRWDGTGGVLIKDTSTLTVDAAGQWAGPAGAAGATTYGFVGDPDTGVYRPGAGQVEVVAGSTAVITATATDLTVSTPVTAPDGSAAAPSYAWTSDTGLFRTTAGGVGAATGGTTAWVASVGANSTLAGAEASTYGGGSGVVFVREAAVVPTTNPSAGGLLYVQGTSLRWRDTTGTVSVLTDGVTSSTPVVNDAVMVFDGTSGKSTTDVSLFGDTDGGFDGGFQGVDGAAATPTYSFSSATNLGVYYAAGTPAVVLVNDTAELQAGTAACVATVPVIAPAGSAATPGFGFTTATSSGMFAPTTSTVALAGGGQVGWRGVAAGTAVNVSVATAGTDYAGGEGVVFLDEAATAPAGALTSGGVLYVTGNNLLFHDSAATATNLTTAGDALQGPASSTTGGLTRWSGTAGTTLQDTSGITSTGARLFATGGYTWSGDTDTGMLNASGDVALVAGGVGMTVGTAAVTVNTALHVDGITRVGGASGTSASVTGSVATINHLNAAGTFEWQQDGTAVFGTTAARDLTTAAALEWSDSGETLTAGFTTTYQVESSGTDNIVFTQVATGPTMTLSSTAVTMTFDGATSVTEFLGGVRAADGSAAAPSYAAIATPNTGLYLSATNTAAFVVAATQGMTAAPTGNVGFGTTVPDFAGGEDVVYFSDTTGTTTNNRTNSQPIEVQDGASLLKYSSSDANENVRLNGAAKRAEVSLTGFTVTTGTSTDLDGETWTDVDSVGVNGTTSGALSITDTDATVMVVVRATWVSNATGVRRVAVTTGVGNTVEATATQAAVSGAATSQMVTLVRRLGSADANLQFAVQVEQTSGGDLNVDVVMTLVRMV